MRPKHIIMDLADADLNGTFQDQTTAGAGALVLNGAGVVNGEWVSPDGFARRIDLESAGNLSGVNFTITGFADSGRNIAITEVIAGPNTNTVTTTNYFYSITSITVNGAVGTNVEGGPTDEAVSPIIPLNWRGGTVALNIIVDGTINYTVEHTFNPLEARNHPFDWLDNDDTELVSATDDQNGNFSAIPRATRLKVNSYTNGAALEFSVNQSDV